MEKEPIDSLYEIKTRLERACFVLDGLEQALDINSLIKTLEQMTSKMELPGFWDNPQTAQETINNLNAIKSKHDILISLKNQREEISELIEHNDIELLELLSEEFLRFEKELEEFEINILLSNEYDKNSAILELHPGAGGTESQDWAQMLYRMYTRWAEKNNYKVDIIDYLPGDEAGIKSITLNIKGYNVYGYLKAEHGVHRLVRISPFDSNKRRHTSFASVNVVPEIDNDVNIDIRSEDLKIDTYRSSGAGGQHVNTTDSAIRITHIPTGTVVTCQNQRSQIKNREQAIHLLKSKLYLLEIQKKQSELNAIRGNQQDNAWGSQIRSYVMHPYTMVKDHRTNEETGNVNAVLDGELTSFIYAFLKWDINK